MGMISQLFINARVIKMHSKNARFWDKWAKRYQRKAVPDPEAYAKKLKKTQEFLCADSNVLELGCGTGSTAMAHAPFARTILASDFSPKMIEFAQNRAGFVGIKNVTFKVSDIESEALSATKTPLEKDGYDMVMAHSVLHLVSQPDAVTEFVSTRLKPGGVFVQNTPILGDTKPFLKHVFRFANKVGLLPLLHCLSKNGLFASLEKHGFSIEYEWFHRKTDSIFIIARKSWPGSDVGAIT